MNTQLSRTIFTLALGFSLVPALSAQAPKIDFPALSPASTLKQRVGLTDIEVVYSRPGVKGREVFGKLEPYGVVWRTGANAATKITFSTPIKFGGQDVPAGTYALFSIPDASEWTVILNKVTGQWGAYTYDQKNDLLRVKVAAVKLAESVETFTIDVNDIRDESATLDLIWQNTRVPVPIAVDLVSTLQPQIEAALGAGKKVDPNLYDRAARFYLDHNLDLKKATEWIDAAIAQKPSFFFYYHKALILAGAGDKAGATEAANKSIEMAKEAGGSAKDEYIRLNQMVLSGLGK